MVSPTPPVLLYCSAINKDGAASFELDSSLEGSTSKGVLVGIPKEVSWKEKLLKFSNYASILCVID